MKDVKSKILGELINVLNEEDGKMLKKHPKIMAAKVTIAKPLDKKEEMKKEEMGDMEGMDAMEGMDDLEGLDDLESLSPEMKEKILNLLSK